MKKSFQSLSILLLIFTSIFINLPGLTEFYQNEATNNDISPTLSNGANNTSFIYGAARGPLEIDPIDVWGQDSLNVLDQVAEGLFTYNYSDPSNAIIPNLAADMGNWSADYKSYTVSLKQGITFHDGTPFNYSAVQYCVERYQYFMNATGAITDPNDFPLTQELYRWPNGTLIINRTEFVDVFTIKFVLNHYYAAFESLLCFNAMYILAPSKTPLTERIDINTGKIFGTGPFVYDGYNSGVNVTFHAFENYRKGPAQIKSLIFSIIEDPLDRALALLNGEIDMIDSIDPDMISILKEDPDITVLESEKTNLITYFILMNNNLLSKTMRNAISYVIDYDYIIYEIMGGTAERLKSAIPNGILYANDTFNYPVYNISKARQFLVDGGIVPAYYNDGVNDYHDFHQHINGTMPPIAEYTYIYNADNLLRGKIGILLKDNLANLGIKLTLNGMSFSKYISYLIGFPPYSRDDFHLAMAGWVEDYNDPINYINTLLNPSQIYDYAQVDDLYLNTAMEEALKITDPKAREAKYDEMQQYIIEDLMPLAYLYVQNLSCAHHSDLIGFQQNAFNNLNFHTCQWNRTQYSMEITRPNDLTFFEGTIGNSITWNITAMNVSTPIYYVYKGMDLVQSDVWDSGVPVNINIDELSTGTYQYRIEVHNSDKIVEDIVDVKVVDIESNIPFIYGLSSRVRDLDPVDAWDIASINVLDQVAEGLFTYNYSDPSNAIIPNLAADMGTWSADYKNYTVTLKPNITFHDGTPFNATAVKFSVDRYQYFMNATGELTDWYYPTTAQLYVWPNQTLIINRTEVIDDYTVRFVLNHYYAPFEALLCFPSMYILSPTAHAAHATTRIPTDETGDIVGTGPFVFDGYNPLVNVTFHAFEDYRKGPAQIKSLVFSIIIDPFDRFLALLNGDIGMVDRIESLYVNTIDPDMISILKNDPGITVLESEKTSTDINLISMNNNFLDNITRKAIAYAIDYDFIIDEIMEGTAERLKSAIPNGIIYANDTFDYPTFNITFARTIMQWMGYGVGWNISYNPDNPYANPDHYNWINANFMELKYIYNTDNLLRAKFGILLMENLMLIGINVTLTGMSFYEFLYRIYRIPAYTPYEFHLANMGWWPDYNDPSDFINPLFTPGSASNYGEVDEPLYNQWMDKALKITDPKAREAKYDDIQQIIIEDFVNYAYTHVQKLVCAHHSDLTGFQQNAFNKLNFHTCLWKPIPPGNFNLTTGAGTPDTDGNFNLNWTISANAQNYSVYQYSQFITKINGSLTPLILETVALSLPLSGYSDGTYYFIVVAHNEFGNTLSDCIDVVVQIPQPPGPFTLYSDAGTPDTDGNFNLNWTISANAQNYSVYQYSQFITKINGSLTPLILETVALSLPLSGYSDGTYYFIVVAHNEYGNTLSSCLKISVQILPGPFTLYSDTGTTDDDGSFNLNWDISVYADNYSVYQYSNFITEINGSLTPLILETEDLTFPISGLTSGDYYFIVVAHNEYGNILSNCLKVSVQIPPGPINLWSNADSPDSDGTFSLFWNSSSNAISYSVYQYDSFITQINGSLIPLAEDTQIHVLPLTGYQDGEYYFIAVAHNDYGDTLSKCIKVVVSTPKPAPPVIPGYNFYFLIGILCIISIWLVKKFNVKSYKI